MFNLYSCTNDNDRQNMVIALCLDSIHVSALQYLNLQNANIQNSCFLQTKRQLKTILDNENKVSYDKTEIVNDNVLCDTKNSVKS